MFAYFNHFYYYRHTSLPIIKLVCSQCCLIIISAHHASTIMFIAYLSDCDINHWRYYLFFREIFCIPSVVLYILSAVKIWIFRRQAKPLKVQCKRNDRFVALSSFSPSLSARLNIHRSTNGCSYLQFIRKHKTKINCK